MTAEATDEAGADQPAADQPAADQPAAPTPPTSTDVGPTFQTAGSEAAEVAAQAVARQVALTTAANAAASMAAAEAQAAREAIDEAQVSDAVSTTEADASTESNAAGHSPAVATATDAERQSGSEALGMGSADGAPSRAGAAPGESTDASMSATAPFPIAEAPVPPAAPVAPMGSTSPAPAAPAASRKPRRPVILAWTRRFVVFAVSIALLAGGVVLGSASFQRTRTAPTEGGAVEFTQPPADVAKEFIAALAADDSDAIRSSLSTDTNKDLIDEFTKFGIKKVNKVETLGTSVDGPRSATEVLLHTTDSEGNAFDINLIILVNGNAIEGFR